MGVYLEVWPGGVHRISRRVCVLFVTGGGGSVLEAGLVSSAGGAGGGGGFL